MEDEDELQLLRTLSDDALDEYNERTNETIDNPPENREKALIQRAWFAHVWLENRYLDLMARLLREDH